MSYVNEQNANKPATRKQLFALYVASKKHGCTHDYRGDNLTLKQASELLAKFNSVGNIGVGVTTKAAKAPKVSKEKKLEKEFISYMSEKMEGIIATARQALKLKSVVEDDPMFFPNKKDRKQFAFFGFGCGISIIQYDKRSNIGKQIEELSRKHRMTTFLKMFLKGFSEKEINYMESVGFPLSAMYYQDYQIGRSYMGAVMSFMEMKGVKNLHVKTFDD